MKKKKVSSGRQPTSAPNPRQSQTISQSTPLNLKSAIVPSQQETAIAPIDERMSMELNRILLVGIGRTDSSGQLRCGLKDLIDVLKNIVLIGGLLFSCLSVAVAPNPKLPLDSSWIGIVGVLPLTLILLAAMGQVFLILDNIVEASSTFGTAFTKRMALLLMAFAILGIASGMVCLVLKALSGGVH